MDQAFTLLSQWGGNLVVGAINTVLISLCAYGLGFILGLSGAVGKLSGGPIVRGVLNVYTTLVRSLPELLLIVILYYLGTQTINNLLATYEMSITINGFIAASIVLGFVSGAYQTEVLRGAIQAIPIGQIEAGMAYGMSPALRFRRIVLPAMLPHAIPGMSNLWLNITKDSALVGVVGYAELTLQTRQAAGGTKWYFTFYLASMALYLAISLVSLWFFRRLESRVRVGQARV
jgi:polar amino acid transport system permease protein